jgi:hypothetical protein
MRSRLWWINGILVFLLSACSLIKPGNDRGRETLAEFTESYVHVLIELVRTGDEQASLAATFTPTEADAHLYSMDLPKQGVNGLGRPTLIELPEGSSLQAAGGLQESVESNLDSVSAELPALAVYPAGAVTLTLPVNVPETGNTPIDDHVLITYMACTSNGCHAPVLEKIVDVQIPGE